MAALDISGDEFSPEWNYTVKLRPPDLWRLFLHASLMQRSRERFAEGRNKPFPGPVEVDQTAVGGKRKDIHKSKRKELSGRGSVGKPTVAGEEDQQSKQTSATVVQGADAETLQGFVTGRSSEAATVYTDEASAYVGISRPHETVHHDAGEYVRGDATVNGIEGFWSLFKRCYHGAFHHLSEKHFDRYVQESAGRKNIRSMDTIDQMKTLGRRFDGRRLRYKSLIANNELPKSAKA